ncbi:hypothetical protein Q8A73_022690, partial [Channa argus]
VEKISSKARKSLEAQRGDGRKAKSDVGRQEAGSFSEPRRAPAQCARYITAALRRPVLISHSAGRHGGFDERRVSVSGNRWSIGEVFLRPDRESNCRRTGCEEEREEVVVVVECRDREAMPGTCVSHCVITPVPVPLLIELNWRSRAEESYWSHLSSTLKLIQNYSTPLPPSLQFAFTQTLNANGVMRPKTAKRRVERPNSQQRMAILRLLRLVSSQRCAPALPYFKSSHSARLLTSAAARQMR